MPSSTSTNNPQTQVSVDMNKSSSTESLPVSTRTSTWSSGESGDSSHIYINLLPHDEGLSDMQSLASPETTQTNNSDSLWQDLSNLPIPHFDYGATSDSASHNSSFNHDHRGYVDTDYHEVVACNDCEPHISSGRPPLSSAPVFKQKPRVRSARLMYTDQKVHSWLFSSNGPKVYKHHYHLTRQICRGDIVFARCSLTSLPSNMTDSILEPKVSKCHRQSSKATSPAISSCKMAYRTSFHENNHKLNEPNHKLSCLKSNESINSKLSCGFTSLFSCGSRSGGMVS